MHTAVLRRLGRQIELAEDAADVRFDGLRRYVELLRDAAVRSSFRDEREHLELPRRQLCKRAAREGGPSLGYPAQLRLEARVLECERGRSGGRVDELPLREQRRVVDERRERLAVALEVLHSAV